MNTRHKSDIKTIVKKCFNKNDFTYLGIKIIIRKCLVFVLAAYIVFWSIQVQHVPFVDLRIIPFVAYLLIDVYIMAEDNLYLFVLCHLKCTFVNKYFVISFPDLKIF